MPSRYLFLDIDGVLHPADAHFAIDDVKVPLQELQAAGLFVHLDLLARMLAEHQDVSLVVHSSWRLTHSDDELRALFGTLAGQVVGTTERGLDRRLSISDWALRRHLGPLQYRVLDDQPELLTELGDVVIECDPILGLATQSVQLRLMDWLKANTQKTDHDAQRNLHQWLGRVGFEGGTAQDLHASAADVFETKTEAEAWLHRPHPMLAGQTPLEHAETTAGEQRVVGILVALKHGGVV